MDLESLVPKRIKVGAGYFDIELQDATWRTNSGAYGTTDIEARVINVANLSHDIGVFIDTLWHEIKHTAWDFMYLPSKADEESVCSKMSTAEMMILKDNPQLYKLFGALYSEGE